MLFCVDASGSMAARKRMEQVKTAVLVAAARRLPAPRQGRAGDLPRRRAPSWRCRRRSSVDIAAARLDDLPAGGRTPLAEGLLEAARVLELERIRDPRRRPLLVVVTDGRATAGRRRRRALAPGRRARSPAAGVASRGRRLRERADAARAGRARWPSTCGAEHVPVAEVSAEARCTVRHRSRRDRVRLMPQGQPLVVPDDGLTTRQRRNRPLLMVHTGDGKGKSTAAFGLALRGWNQGWNIGVFQFVKSAKWRIGEQTVLERLGELHEETGEGGPVEWHKMGAGWSWSRKAGDAEDHAADGRRGLGRDQAPARRGDARPATCSTSSPTRSSGAGSTSTTCVETLANRPGRQHVVDHRPPRRPAAGRGRRPGHRDDQGQAPDGRRPEGPAGHRVVSRCPALVVAAPATGQGKTTVATGLMAALRRAGHEVSGHKVGPDYIDPGYHALASGRPGRNLDPHLVGEERVVPLLLHGAAGADVAVIEGVMGLYDGRVGARRVRLHRPRRRADPHARSCWSSTSPRSSRSVGAVVHGMATFDPSVRRSPA